MTADQIAKLVIQTDATSAPETVKLRCSGSWTVQGIAQLEQQLKGMTWPVAAVSGDRQFGHIRAGYFRGLVVAYDCQRA